MCQPVLVLRHLTHLVISFSLIMCLPSGNYSTCTGLPYHKHLALLITPLQTSLAHPPIYWSPARDFKGLAFSRIHSNSSPILSSLEEDLGTRLMSTTQKALPKRVSSILVSLKNVVSYDLIKLHPTTRVHWEGRKKAGSRGWSRKMKGEVAKVARSRHITKFPVN